ncbi:MAG TPA: MFS transporter [Tenuifilaceae bacterium]|nr:MFS transporter [Tenuifilaceae bacterium]
MFRYIDIRSYFPKIGFAFRALKSRNYMLFFVGQSISLMGTFIQNLALGWLVYRLTSSSFLLGAVGFAGQIPSLFLTPFAGVFADRLNRRKVLIATQTLSMLMAFLLVGLYETDSIKIWHIIVISVINGFSLAFDTPFRHAFIIEMVGDKELLQNAIALNSTLINSARFIGPTIGGFLIAWLGEGACFIINGVSFMAVIGSLMAMRIVPLNRGSHRSGIVRELLEGLQYSYHAKTIWYLLLLVAMFGFLGLPFQIFLPVFARDILHGSSQTLGFLTGAFGAGALLGAFYLASRKSVCSLPKIILMSSMLFAVGLLGFSVSSNIILSLSIIFVLGFGMVSLFAGTNTLLQQIVDDDKRGRVVALYGMSFMGITPLGSLLLGSITPLLGVQITFVVAAGLCLVAAFAFSKKLPTVKTDVCG